MKIKLKTWNDSVKFPEICMVTGKNDPMIEPRPISSIQTVETLPISEAGWEKYRNSFNGLDRLNESIDKICSSIPLLGSFLFILYFFYIFIPSAIINLFIGKKLKISLKREGHTPFVRGAILEVPSEEFANEFVKLNKDLDAKIVS